MEKEIQQDLTNFNALLFSRILYKTDYNFKKNGQILLGTDILKDEVKKNLLCLCTQNLEKIYQTLHEKENSIKFLEKNKRKIFLTLLLNTCEDFLINQYGCNIHLNKKKLQTSSYTEALLKDINIFFQIPLSALLEPKPLEFKLVYYPIYTYPTENFLEALLENIIIEIANCIMHFNISYFSSLYTFRQTLYKSKFLSLRNFERFKNNLFWQLSLKKIIQRPTDLYNSAYRIYVLRTKGILNRTIYANRSNQLTTLTQTSLLTITLLELKDFLLTRLDEALYVLGKSLRFTLTSVIGQVIGLIWRGIIEGLKR